jgi:simple sugar transport system permease protein
LRSACSDQATGRALRGFPDQPHGVFRLPAVRALAGLAGISEVAGAIGRLQPSISPGYGFTAIIVAFLGRLNPLGIVAAGLVLALTYLGGEAVQSALGVSDKVARAGCSRAAPVLRARLRHADQLPHSLRWQPRQTAGRSTAKTLPEAAH